MKGSASGYDRSNYIDTPANYILLIGVSLFFWIAGYVDSIGYPVYSEVSATPLWDMVCHILPGKAVTYLIGFLLLAGGAFLIHRANYMLIIIREKTFMPFLFYFLFISSNANFIPLTSASLSIFCLILSFYQLFTVYHDPLAIGKMFNAAFFIGIGSLLWVHVLWFLPLFWWGMYYFKSMSIRTFGASICGLATIYWFLLGWCVWQHDFTPFSLPFGSLFKVSFPDLIAMWLVDWLSILFVLFLALMAMGNILLHEYDDNLRTRQFLFFFIIFTLGTFGLCFVYAQQSAEFQSVACMPFSILLAHFFTTAKGKKRHWLYYAAILIYIFLAIIRSPWGPFPPDVL
ncbi:hypothetical protein AGMMS49574_08710 [Bacteroidia bacterium]|nr:hypothetical protein AGMMS49574_08710 [Bacteroidia bacterium]